MTALSPIRSRVLVLALAGLALSGCAAIDAVNTVTGRDPILPGERQALVPDADIRTQEAVGGVSIGGARANAEWAQPGGNAQNDPGHVAYSGGGWRTTIPAAGRRSARPFATPVVAGGLVYVYGNDASVSAHSLSGGGRAWSVNLRPEGERASPGGGVAASGGRVYVATGYRELHALDGSSGATVWTREFDAPLRGAPTVVNGRIYVVDANNTVHAASTGDGAEIWTFEAIPEQDGILSGTSAAVSGNTVIVPSITGQIIALGAADGAPKWADNLVRGNRNIAGSSVTDVAGRPVIEDGIVYAIGTGGRMVATRVSNGSRVWSQNIGGQHQPILSGNTVFVVDTQNRAVALDKATGEVRWFTQLPPRKQNWAGPVLAGNRLWVGSTTGDVLALDPATGQTVANQDLRDAIYMSPIAAGGRLIFVGGRGTLAAL
ncbi:MAG: PQQ-binding-like beta-propeller repeat protein [Pseudomonadota bacterium]